MANRLTNQDNPLILAPSNGRGRGGRCILKEQEPEVREGFFQDKYGQWHPDRRAMRDRRGHKHSYDHDRRTFFRRKADREILVKDHRSMIEDALGEFAEEHDGHL